MKKKIYGNRRQLRLIRNQSLIKSVDKFNFIIYRVYHLRLGVKKNANGNKH